MLEQSGCVPPPDTEGSAQGLFWGTLIVVTIRPDWVARLNDSRPMSSSRRYQKQIASQFLNPL
ncbi:MAG: hypothetical protein NVSMB42_05400 [Herpetosiphon sp.]